MRLKFLALFVLFGLTLAIGAKPEPVKDEPAAPVRADDKKDDPKNDKEPKSVKTGDGQTFKLVDREQLRTNGRKFQKKRASFTLPAAPASCNWTKGNTIDLPVLGNDQVGDCYYVYCAHQVQIWNGMLGRPVNFDERALIARYRKISGGDNGLSDDDIFGSNHNGEFYGGVIGPAGPHKILDHLLVNPSDKEAVKLAVWRFGGCGYTCSLLNTWMNNVAPNVLWDDRGTPDRWAGHAMLLDGYTEADVYSCETWGLKPPVRLTRAGMLKSDPELIVCFSKEWYDRDTGKSPAGYHYTEDAALWKQMGGRDLPPWDGPAPVPPTPVPPTPPNPNPPVGPAQLVTVVVGTDAIIIDPVTKTVKFPAGWNSSAPAPASIEAELKASGVSPAVIADVIQLLADVKSRPTDPAQLAAWRAKLLGDVLKLIADLGAP